MSKNTQFGHGFKRQIQRFIAKKISGLGKISERFIYEMVFGMCKSGDIKISNIARSLDEKGPLRYTLKRLYNRLNSQDYSDVLNTAVLHDYNDVNKDTVWALDFSDIIKPYAQKMEHLSYVRDADKGTIGLGYNQVVVTATQLGKEDPVVVANELFSKAANPDKKSTDIALELLEKLYSMHGNTGVYVQDRYFDNRRFYKGYAATERSFVTRAKENRKMLKVNHNNKIVPGKVAITELAKNCKTPFSFDVQAWENGQWKKRKRVLIGARKVFLPCINQIVTLVVIKGFGKVPMMLITNINIATKNQYDLQRIFRLYRARWKCEEWIRYVKQAYNMEDVRCLNYTSIKNVLALVTFVTYFLCKRIGISPQLREIRQHVLQAGKPIIFDKAKCTLYMISAGIKVMLKNITAGFKRLNQIMHSELQLVLDL